MFRCTSPSNTDNTSPGPVAAVDVAQNRFVKNQFKFACMSSSLCVSQSVQQYGSLVASKVQYYYGKPLYSRSQRKLETASPFAYCTR